MLSLRYSFVHLFLVHDMSTLDSRPLILRLLPDHLCVNYFLRQMECGHCSSAPFHNFLVSLLWLVRYSNNFIWNDLMCRSTLASSYGISTKAKIPLEWWKHLCWRVVKSHKLGLGWNWINDWCSTTSLTIFWKVSQFLQKLYEDFVSDWQGATTFCHLSLDDEGIYPGEIRHKCLAILLNVDCVVFLCYQ